MQRNGFKGQAPLGLLAVLANMLVSGCVTVNVQKAATMSNGMLCEMLGPKWVTSATERDTLYKEIEARGITCANGQVVTHTARTPQAAPAAPPQPNEPEAEVPSDAEACAALEGAAVIADDETYLGELTNEYASDSIYNQYGSHGSKYASDSIWNPYGSYGSAYSSSSPWNKYSSSGPLIVKNGTVLGQLTINKDVNGGVHPTVVGSVCFDSDRGNPN